MASFEQKYAGKTVWVYRNLRHGRNVPRLYSVMVAGRVVARVHRLLLSGCRFVVRPAGNKKVAAGGYKNVHAFVVGVVVSDRGCMGIDKTGRDFGVPVRHNPKAHTSFVSGHTNNPISVAEAVLFNERGVSACYTS